LGLFVGFCCVGEEFGGFDDDVGVDFVLF